MKWLYLACIFLSLFSCKSDAEKPKDKNPIVDIIDNPITASGNSDTTMVARISTDTYVHRFDTVPEGAIVDHTFFFTNAGRQPLHIYDARSECGCTVAEYSDEVIAPGRRGFVKISFDSDGRSGFQERPIFLFANTLPQKTTFKLSGYVEPEK